MPVAVRASSMLSKVWQQAERSPITAVHALNETSWPLTVTSYLSLQCVPSVSVTELLSGALSTSAVSFVNRNSAHHNHTFTAHQHPNTYTHKQLDRRIGYCSQEKVITEYKHSF